MKSSFRIAHRHEGAFINTYFARLDTMEGAELRKLVTYNTIDGFVADVIPGHMKDFADEFAKRLPSTVADSREG